LKAIIIKYINNVFGNLPLHVHSGPLLCTVIQWTGNPGCMFDLLQVFGEVSCFLNFLLQNMSESVLDKNIG